MENKINENVQPSIEVKSKDNKRVLILSSVFVLLCICLGLVYFLFLREDSVFEEKVSELEKTEGPRGEIFLTLSPLGEEKPPNIYTLNLETMELDEYFNDSENANFMGSFSSDGNRMVFVRVYVDEVEEKLEGQILILNELTGEEIELTERFNYFPRNPKFSPDNAQIVYWMVEKEDGENPEDSSIYILNLDGESEKITEGAFPLFSPDGKYLLVLKNDGLYTVDLVTKEEHFVLEYTPDVLDEYYEIGEMEKELPNWLNFRMSYSYEKNLLMLTETISSDLFILEVASWSPFEYEILFDADFYTPNWPVFSPCGKYFAIQEFASEDSSSSHVGVFDLETLEREKSFSLEIFERDYIWLTDWLIK